VQIAAYRTRPQAEALRDKLATSGLDVRVVEGEAASGVMYRVQIGEYATREAARAAAARLAAERSVAPFVTQR
jgi:cell division protein FtsN